MRIEYTGLLFTIICVHYKTQVTVQTMCYGNEAEKKESLWGMGACKQMEHSQWRNSRGEGGLRQMQSAPPQHFTLGYFCRPTGKRKGRKKGKMEKKKGKSKWEGGKLKMEEG